MAAAIVDLPLWRIRLVPVHFACLHALSHLAHEFVDLRTDMQADRCANVALGKLLMQQSKGEAGAAAAMPDAQAMAKERETGSSGSGARGAAQGLQGGGDDAGGGGGDDGGSSGEVGLCGRSLLEFVVADDVDTLDELEQSLMVDDKEASSQLVSLHLLRGSVNSMGHGRREALAFRVGWVSPLRPMLPGDEPPSDAARSIPVSFRRWRVAPAGCRSCASCICSAPSHRQCLHLAFPVHLNSAALFWGIGVLRPFLCSSVDRMGTRGYRQLLLYTDLLGVPAPPASAATRANSG